MSEETRAEEVSKAKETITRSAKSGAFAAASGGVTAVRAANALRKRQWKRAGARLLAAGVWFGVAAAQRRMGGGESGYAGPDIDADVDQRDVADTTPDIEDVATDADEGTGTESHGEPSDVVDPMSADIDESNTATQLDSDVDSSDVEQRDVVESGVDAGAAGSESEDEVPEEPAHTDHANVVAEEDDESALGGDETEGAAAGGTDGDDEDVGTASDDAEPRDVDDDTEPAITEADDAEEEEGEE